MSGYNYLSGAEFDVDSGFIEFLSNLDDWVPRDDCVKLARGLYGELAPELVKSALSIGALIARDTPEATKEDIYASDWGFNMPSAMLHFAVSDRDYVELEDWEQVQAIKSETTPRPQLFLKNDPSRDEEILPCSSPKHSGAIELLRQRRTLRECPESQMSYIQLSNCLYAGLGITGWTENIAGRLPLKMTPSGGASNPFEAYIYCHAVEGLSRGFYHYSAAEHTLQKCASIGNRSAQSLLGGQDWANNAACIIFLCCDLRRPMWKYEGDDNVYRAMLIEAGHIGQNIMIAGTESGLSVCPSAAVSHKPLHELLNLDGVTNSVIYSLSIMEASKFEGEAPVIETNPVALS